MLLSAAVASTSTGAPSATWPASVLLLSNVSTRSTSGLAPSNAASISVKAPVSDVAAGTRSSWVSPPAGSSPQAVATARDRANTNGTPTDLTNR